MSDHDAHAARPVTIVAVEAAPRTKPSNYPEPFISMMQGRTKRPQFAHKDGTRYAT